MVGCPRARTQIVPPEDVLDNQAIHIEKCFRISMEELLNAACSAELQQKPVLKFLFDPTRD
jgi:hypothetical protein